MDDNTGKCRVGFPKPYSDRTILVPGRSPIYRRPNDGMTFIVHKDGVDVPITNADIVPFNPWSLMLLDCHINTEGVFSLLAPKYLTAYATKGATRVIHEINLGPTNSNVTTIKPISALPVSRAAIRFAVNMVHSIAERNAERRVDIDSSAIDVGSQHLNVDTQKRARR